MNENEIVVGPEFDFQIRDIVEDVYQGREVLAIILTCCRTGDVVFIDKETGEVIGYQFGAW